MPRWRLWNEDSLFIYTQRRLTPLRVVLISKSDSLLPSSTVTAAGALEPLTSPGERVKLNAIRVLVVGKLFCKISSVTPKGEIVRLRARGGWSPIAFVFLVFYRGSQCGRGAV